MPLALANFHSILVGRRRKVLTFLGLSTAIDGSNPELGDPLGRAVRVLGGTTEDPEAPTIEEVQAVVDVVGLDRLLDKADIHLGQRILDNWDEASFTLGSMSQQSIQLREQTQKDQELKVKAYAGTYPPDPVDVTGTSASAGGVRVGRVCRSPWAGQPYRSRRGW